jgi:Ca2+-binding RTX toxin-like protein
VSLFCDSPAQNSIVLDWGQRLTPRAHRFILTSTAAAGCSDHPAFSPGSPPTAFDTHQGHGTGTYDGAPGHTIEWVYIDNGEPGKRRDRVRLAVRNGSNAIVLSVNRFVGEGNLDASGILQGPPLPPPDIGEEDEGDDEDGDGEEDSGFSSTPGSNTLDGNAALGQSDGGVTANASAIQAACLNKIRGTKQRDRLRGTVASDRIESFGGDDKVSALAGDDCVTAAAGKDGLSGGAGDDLLNGGANNDRLSGGIGLDVLLGGKGHDKLRGDAGNDRLSGGDGRDSLKGGAGADRLNGGAGRDRLSGGSGNNRYVGGSGNDVLSARNGFRDVVNCGSGDDRARVDPIDVVRGCEQVS